MAASPSLQTSLPEQAGFSAPQALVIDGRPLVLAALGRLLSGPPLNAEVALTTRSTDALELVEQGSIDLVLCDVRAVHGTELPGLLIAQRPRLRVILLAEPDDEPLLMAALHSGAAGFFTKDTGVDEFLEGVAAVRQGEYVVGRNLIQRALAKLSNREDQAPPSIDKLSQAERAILVLIGQAHSIRSIAAARGISQKTVRNHVAHVYRKLKLRNRAEAILWAARTGLCRESTGP